MKSVVLLACLAWLGSTGDPEMQAAPAPATAEAKAPVPATAVEPPTADPQAPGAAAAANEPGAAVLKGAEAAVPEAPPPSAWDKKRQAEGVSDTPVEEERSLLSQLGRTVGGLFIVVALIVLTGRFAMHRLGRVALGVGGKHVSVLERVQLDSRHALFVVDVRGGPRLLLGGGDGSVHVVQELPRDDTGSSGGPSGFRAALKRQTDAGKATPAMAGHEDTTVDAAGIKAVPRG